MPPLASSLLCCSSHFRVLLLHWAYPSEACPRLASGTSFLLGFPACSRIACCLSVSPQTTLWGECSRHLLQLPRAAAGPPAEDSRFSQTAPPSTPHGCTYNHLSMGRKATFLTDLTKAVAKALQRHSGCQGRGWALLGIYMARLLPPAWTERYGATCTVLLTTCHCWPILQEGP